MSSHETAAREIKRAWWLAWQNSPIVSMPVEQANTRFEQPKAAPWGRLSIICGDTIPISIAKRKTNRTPFVLALQVFVPEGKGTLQAQRAADALSLIDYYSVTISGLTVRFDTAGWTTAVGPVDGFEQFLVTIRGTYDIRKDIGQVVLTPPDS